MISFVHWRSKAIIDHEVGYDEDIVRKIVRLVDINERKDTNLHLDLKLHHLHLEWVEGFPLSKNMLIKYQHESFTQSF